MRPRFLILLVVVALVAAGTLTFLPAQEPPAGESADAAGPNDQLSRPASAVLLIVSNPAVFSLEPETVGVAVEHLTATVEGLKEAGYEVGYLPLPGGGEGRTVGKLMVRPVSDAAEAEKILHAVRERLQQFLNEVAEASLQPLKQQLDEAHERVERAEAVTKHRAEELRELRGRLIEHDVSPEGIGEGLHELRHQRLHLRVELAGLHARHEAIVRHIARIDKELDAARERPQRELAELEKVVDALERELARVHELVERRAAAETEARQAEAELAMARAELEERRRLIAQDAGGEHLGGLNHQLVEVQIETAAAEARLEVINHVLRRLESGEVQELVHNHRRAERQLDRALEEKDAAIHRAAELAGDLAMIRMPKVILIGRR